MTWYFFVGIKLRFTILVSKMIVKYLSLYLFDFKHFSSDCCGQWLYEDNHWKYWLQTLFCVTLNWNVFPFNLGHDPYGQSLVRLIFRRVKNWILTMILMYVILQGWSTNGKSIYSLVCFNYVKRTFLQQKLCTTKGRKIILAKLLHFSKLIHFVVMS